MICEIDGCIGQVEKGLKYKDKNVCRVCFEELQDETKTN